MTFDEIANKSISVL